MKLSERVSEIFKRWQHANQDPTTELNYHNDFELLCAVILSAQSTDKAVNLVTPKLFKLGPTPEKMSQLTVEDISNCINRLGLHQAKARYLLEMSQALVAHFNAQVPDTREALESLAGVGRKTANVVLNTAFAHAVIAVDTHIFRVAKRLGFSKGKTPRAVEDDLMRIIPKIYLKDAHHWMILHGRYTCQAKKPKCQACIIHELCPSRDII
ncbi:MAG: endonuclease III [Gammaproteobacteria bacterium]|nr:endonuclease III [Gammaproteobacteria bacterium]